MVRTPPPLAVCAANWSRRFGTETFTSRVTDNIVRVGLNYRGGGGGYGGGYGAGY